MKKGISMNQLDALIRKNIQNKNLGNPISEDKVQEIKNKIVEKLSSFKSSPGAQVMEEQIDDEQLNAGEEVRMPVQTSQSAPIIQQAQPDTKSLEIAKKEGEIETKEQMLIRKEMELNKKEQELRLKEQELSYKPQMPDFIEKAEPEKLFIYNENELSLGSESLISMPYGLVSNPEQKKSMHDLWLEKGKVRAEIYKVEFNKIGEMVFQPLNGVCKFEQMSQAIPQDIPSDDRESVQQAIMSQYPTEEMVDSTEPVKDVTLDMTNDMGLNAPDIAAAMEKVINSALETYLKNKNSVQ